jgi:tyrosine-protein kinase Etk/Wzc
MSGSGEMSRTGMPEAAVRDGELDLGAVRRALMRKKWWVLGPTLAVAALAFVGVNMLTPKYKSEARILIEGRENVFLRPEAEKSGERDRAVDQEAVTSQVQLALSRDLARQVIKQLKLGERPEFDPTLRGISLVRYSLGFLGLTRDPLQMTPEERVLEAYYERLTVFPVDKSRVISVEFSSSDPELAAKVVNTIADTYLAFQQTARQDQTRAAGRWLEGEIDVLRKKVAEAEAKVEDFRSKTNLYVGTNNTTLSSQTLGDSNRDLVVARTQKAEIDARARYIRESLRRGSPIEASEIINSELIRRLSEQRVTLRAQLAEQSSTLLDAHPRIKELKAQILDLDRQIRGEAERLVRSLETDARIAGARVESLTNSLDQLKRQASSASGQDVELRALEREAKAQRDLLESYLAKYREATARDSLGSAPADARIISRAIVSNTPYFPKKLPIVLIATLATLFMSAGFITTGELLAGNVYRSNAPAQASWDEPAAEAAAARIVDESPLVPAAAPQPMASRADKPTAAAGEPLVGLTIAAIAQPIASGEAGRRVAVIGAAREVGTTLTAIALARTLAEKARVVLVDLSLESPNLTAIAADARAPGIADLVRGAASFGQIITRDRFSRVQLITAGRAGTDTAAILVSERLSIALDALARTYDHVLIDAGAVSADTVQRIARLAPHAVLVAPTTADEVADAAFEMLSRGGFADITVFAGTAPQLESSDARVVAA